MQHNRIIKLADNGNHAAQTIRMLSDRVDARSLSESTPSKWVTVTRTGTFHDPRYGSFEITHEHLLSMVANFEANTYGQDIVLDLAHRPQEGAAGFIRQLSIEGNGNSYKLRALVAFTPHGIDAVKNKGFIYLSAEYSENFIDNEQRQEHGPLLIGAALTPRPVIKNLDPVQLAESDPDGGPMLVSDRMIHLLSEETHTMNEFLKRLKAALEAKKLAESIVTKLCETFKTVATPMATDELRRELMESFISTGDDIARQLAEAGSAGATIQLSMQAPASGGLTAADVTRILAEAQAATDATARQLAETRDARVGQFTKLLADAKLEGLTEDENKMLAAASELISAEMSAEQVQKLAEQQITVGNQLAASRQLASMGYRHPGAVGSVRISMDESNSVKSLQEKILVGLRGSYVHSTGKLTLAEKPHPFVDKVLAVFDQMHAPRLHAEHKALAGGTTGMVDTNLPVGFQRTVIREALSDLRVLELVQTLTDPSATITTQIPYETRDTSAVMNDGIVYEGQPIHRASVGQQMDTAYILPMKLAMLISNEVMHFTRASAIDWDAYARNVESNARVMRELIVRRICNELQRSYDSFAALDITNEGIDAQLNGSRHTIKTAQFPIVRPHQQRDLQGNVVGAAENPITVRLNGVAISAYNGSGTQSAGTYYRVTNYNLGYIQFVSELGVPVTPPNAAGADNVSYSYATNILKFDIDNGAVDQEIHLNGLLRAIGAQKAMMKDDRYVSPDYLLMSNTLNDTCTNADQFVTSQKKNIHI